MLGIFNSSDYFKTAWGYFVVTSDCWQPPVMELWKMISNCSWRKPTATVHLIIKYLLTTKCQTCHMYQVNFIFALLLPQMPNPRRMKCAAFGKVTSSCTYLFATCHHKPALCRVQRYKRNSRRNRAVLVVSHEINQSLTTQSKDNIMWVKTAKNARIK